MKSSEIDEGPVMVILLSCVAVSLSFVSFGLGFVNLATQKRTTRVATPVQTPAPLPEPVPWPNPHQPDAIAEQQDLEKRQAAVEQQKRDVERQRDELGQAQQALAGSQAALSQLQAEIQRRAREAEEMRNRVNSLERDRDNRSRARSEMERRLAELRRQVGDEERRIEELRKQVDKRKEINVGRLCPGCASLKNPQWVECIEDAAVLQPQGERFTLAQLKANSSPFGQAVKHCSQRSDDPCELIFVVRPKGFPVFEAAREAAEKFKGEKLRVGYEPVDADWVLEYPTRLERRRQ